MPVDSAQYSYRSDAAVPAFPDDRPVVVFDGVCVLCSGWVKFILRRDPQARFRFVIAQSPLGQALYRHYRLDPVDFETNLVIVDGRLYSKLGAAAAVFGIIGGPWRLLAWIRLIPRPLGGWLYDRVARNRYRLFGRTRVCMMPAPDIRARFIGGDA